MRKTIIFSVVASLLLLICPIIVNSNGEINELNTVDIVEKDGFMIIDRYEKDENYTTIVAEIKDGEEQGFNMIDGEVVFENIFDRSDFGILTEEFTDGLNIGDIYLITFYKDEIESIVKNDLKIDIKVIGEVIGIKV